MLQIQRGEGTQELPSPQYVVYVLDKAASLSEHHTTAAYW